MNGHRQRVVVKSSISGWRPVLGLMFFSIFFNNINSVIGCTLSKFAEDSKMSGAVDMAEGRDTTQGDLNKGT